MKHGCRETGGSEEIKKCVSGNCNCHSKCKSIDKYALRETFLKSKQGVIAVFHSITHILTAKSGQIPRTF